MGPLILKSSPTSAARMSPPRTATASLGTSDKSFTHNPLPNPAMYIRLVEVLDDNYSKTIKVRCKLTTWPINDVPSYHAISYTWGDPKSNTFIILNNKSLEVRTNCEFALKQAYWYWKKRPYWSRGPRLYYWIDSICINQASLEEKGQQVSMMGRIYKKASRVLACLGDHCDDSLFFFRKFHGVEWRMVPTGVVIGPTTLVGHSCSCVTNSFRILHRYSTTKRFVLALAHLVMRPYFTRLWILQELQNAQNITILCGKEVLQEEDAATLFEGVFHAYRDYDDEPAKQPNRTVCNEHDINETFSRRSGLPHSGWFGDWLCRVSRRSAVIWEMMTRKTFKSEEDLYMLLKDVVCRLECAEPRDKVYGIISLIDWGDVAPPPPDYTQSDFKVAIQFLEAVTKRWSTRDHHNTLRYLLITTIKIINLDNRSESVADALEARRGPPRDCAVTPAEPRNGAFTIQTRALGWRLLDEDIESNGSKLQSMLSSPPDPDDCPFLLPRWARAGDWAIVMESNTAKSIWYTELDPQRLLSPNFTPFLIMREARGGESDRNMLIGYGFFASQDEGRVSPGFMRGSSLIADRNWERDEGSRTYVDINLDIEDGLVFFLKIKQLDQLVEGSNDWMVDFLETGVCRHQTPGSSYATIISEDDSD